MNKAIVFQTIILAVTALIVAWYTILTSKILRETTRQTGITLRPVVVLSFRQDAARNRCLSAKNIGQGAAFNVRIAPLNVVPGTSGWEIHFEPVHWLASQEEAEIRYKMPVVDSEKTDRGYLFFPQITSKSRGLRIEYEDVEGGRYRQDLTIMAHDEGAPGDGEVSYAPIQKI